MVPEPVGTTSVSLVQVIVKLMVTTSAGKARGGRSQLRRSAVWVIMSVDTLGLIGAASATRGRGGLAYLHNIED